MNKLYEKPKIEMINYSQKDVLYVSCVEDLDENNPEYYKYNSDLENEN